MMKAPTVLLFLLGRESPCCPVHPARQPLSSCLGYQTYRHSIIGLVSKAPLFYFVMAPKHRSSDAGNSDNLLLGLVYKLNFIIGMYV